MTKEVYVQDGVLLFVNITRFCAPAKLILAMVVPQRKYVFQQKQIKMVFSALELTHKMSNFHHLMDAQYYVTY